MRVGLAVSLTAAGKDEEALAEARGILELDPNFVAAYTLQALNVTKAPLPEAFVGDHQKSSFFELLAGEGSIIAP